MKRSLGRYIVADPSICHGRPTFRGTRIFVSDVLDDISRGLAWEAIIERWHDSISKEAIAEAVKLAREALLRQAAALPKTAAGRCSTHLQTGTRRGAMPTRLSDQMSNS